MIFPLEDMAKFKGGMYGITVAASRRAYQLAKLAMYNDPEISSVVEENDGKVVSLAARQLFGGEVQYAIENKIN
ncbi:MAG: DNA-directed RNA polymerase subunit omega [Treponema sp.]|nr:DNA-directed RNA polymerase subunit omega [Candidatus Treponema equi]